MYNVPVQGKTISFAGYVKELVIKGVRDATLRYNLADYWNKLGIEKVGFPITRDPNTYKYAPYHGTSCQISQT